MYVQELFFLLARVFVFFDSRLVTIFVFFLLSRTQSYCIVSSNHLGYPIVTLDLAYISLPRAARGLVVFMLLTYNTLYVLILCIVLELRNLDALF